MEFGPVGVEQALEHLVQVGERGGEAMGRPRARCAERIRHRCNGRHDTLPFSTAASAVPRTDAEPPRSVTIVRPNSLKTGSALNPCDCGFAVSLSGMLRRPPARVSRAPS